MAALVVALTPARASAQAEVIEYYATDAVGSTRVVFAPDGNVKARSDYLPFGEAMASTGNLPAQRFTGQERDGEAGLDNFNARSMAPRYGRFSSTDPMNGWVTDPQSWNRYAYVSSNPLVLVDPTGMIGSYHDSTTVTGCDPAATNVPGGVKYCPGSTYSIIYVPSAPDQRWRPSQPTGGGSWGGSGGTASPGTPGEETSSGNDGDAASPSEEDDPVVDPCAAGANPVFAGKIAANRAAARTAGRILDVASLVAPILGATGAVEGHRLMAFIGSVAPYTRGDFTTPEKRTLRLGFQDVRGAQDAGNFSYYGVGSEFGYSLPTLRAGSFVAAFTFAGSRSLERTYNDEMRDQDVIVGASQCDKK